VVGPCVRVNQLTVKIADDPAHISEQVGPQVGCEERLAVLGGKDDMGEQVGKGVSHRLSPLRGWPHLNSTTRPTAHAVGYSLSALRA
jgi:hypothetical protein